jgi:hypothetical protein
MIAHVSRGQIKHVLLAIALVGAPLAARAQPADPPAATAVRDGSHDFDFEFGDWTMQLKRLVKPLSGSKDWVEYQGSSVVHRIWGGAANVGEIDISGPAGRIQGMSVRVYNPASGQWGLSFASARGGQLGQPMVGGFKDGRGEFYNQETFNDREIFVRFIFSDITKSTFRLEQAFSDDGGKTWEANWLATFRKVG